MAEQDLGCCYDLCLRVLLEPDAFEFEFLLQESDPEVKQVVRDACDVLSWGLIIGPVSELNSFGLPVSSPSVLVIAVFFTPVFERRLLIVGERLILLRRIEPARCFLCSLVCFLELLINALLNARLLQKLVDGRAPVRVGLKHHLNQAFNVLSDVAGHWAVLSLIDGPHHLHWVSLEWLL